MSQFSYTKTIRSHWEVIALVTGIAVVVTLLLAVVSPFKYRATAKVLIIQNQVANLDAYTATKSAEKIGKNLTEVISNSIFYNEVVKANPAIANEFSSDNLKRRKEWQKDVETTIISETGVLQLSVYNVDKQKAAEILQSISAVLLARGQEFHGGGDAVTMKVIDDIYVSKYPVRPNVPMNLAFALVAGLVFGTLLVILQESARQRGALTQSNIFELPNQAHKVEPTREIKGLSLQPILSQPESFVAKNWRIVEEL